MRDTASSSSGEWCFCLHLCALGTRDGRLCVEGGERRVKILERDVLEASACTGILDLERGHGSGFPDDFAALNRGWQPV